MTGNNQTLSPIQKGCVRVVHYTADSTGFHPTVTYEGPDCRRATPSSSPVMVKPILSFVPGQDSSSESNVGLVIPRPVQHQSSAIIKDDSSVLVEPIRKVQSSSSFPSSIQDLLNSFDSPSSSAGSRREPKSLINEPAEEKFLALPSLSQQIPNVASLILDQLRTPSGTVSPAAPSVDPAEPREEVILPVPSEPDTSGLILEVADPTETSRPTEPNEVMTGGDRVVVPADPPGPSSGAAPFLFSHVHPIPGTIFLNGDGSMNNQPIFFRPPSGILRAYVPAYQVIHHSQEPPTAPPSSSAMPVVLGRTNEHQEQLPDANPTWSPYYSAYVHQ